MKSGIFIATAFLWGNVMSFNFPCCWDPILQQWKMNPTPEVVYMMPHSPKVAANCTNDDVACAPKCNKEWPCQEDRSCCACCRMQDLVVIDTDGSADDAMAMAMILNGTRNKAGSTVAGITCTWGSTGIRNATKNVIKTLKACKRFCEMPVCAGADTGLVEADRSPHVPVYGYDAFGDFYYFPDVEEETICAEHPAIFISNLVRENPGKVIILCTGPLTNIAIAAHLYSDFYRHVKQIIYLGGSETGQGSFRKHDPNGEEPAEGASWNDFLDPYAAMAVLNAEADVDGPKITICPEELYSKLNFPWTWRDGQLGKKGTSVMNFFNFAESKMPRDTTGWNCAGALAACILLDPMIVTQEVLGRSIVGNTGIMKVDSTAPRPNVRVIRAVDEAKVEKMIISGL